MSKVDFGNYKRLVQAFWDPEPRNDDAPESSIWCLGTEYPPKPVQNGDEWQQVDTEPGSGAPPAGSREGPAQASMKIKLALTNGTTDTGPESEADRGWPPEYLDDCEARVWFTYRSSFPSIKKSSDASMTLSVRLRNLGDQGGFTSDTGWGCMIRSGQSLLANALVMLHLGRGTSCYRRNDYSVLTLDEIGGEDGGNTKNGNSSLSLQMIRTRPSPYIAS